KAKWDAKEPVVWTKVHDMPDFVRFSHRPHVQKGIDCAECHGDVQSMVTVQQAKSMQMGWCVECHQKNQAPIACSTCHY
ncbi:MAG: cytochrome c3 family protein, partial [Pseudobdellovibrionaceae bacterium]|nr:cytochrome c3 family protein [Pseudobdellovibrionaceae bacterium]